MKTIQQLIDEGVAKVTAPGGPFRDKGELEKVIAHMGLLINPVILDRKIKRGSRSAPLNLTQLDVGQRGFKANEAKAIAIALGYRGNEAAEFVSAAETDNKTRDFDDRWDRNEKLEVLGDNRMLEILAGARMAIGSGTKEDLTRLVDEVDTGFRPPKARGGKPARPTTVIGKLSAPPFPKPTAPKAMAPKPPVAIPQVKPVAPPPTPVLKEALTPIVEPTAMPMSTPLSDPTATGRIHPYKQAELNTCFVTPNPVIDSNKMGWERAFEVRKFFKMLREAHSLSDMMELAKAVKLKNPWIDEEVMRQNMRKMCADETENENAPSDKAKQRSYRITLGEDFAEALLKFAYPDNEVLQKACRYFLTSKKYWVRKTHSAVPETGSEGITSTPVTIGFKQTTFNQFDSLSFEAAEKTMDETRRSLACMKPYNREQAEDIAIALFKKLSSGYDGGRLTFLSIGEVNGKKTGLNSGTISRWFKGRKEGGIIIPQKVDIDTVILVCDALAHSIIPTGKPAGKALAAEAANYMAALPWTGGKSGSQILDYTLKDVVEHQRNTGTFMLLSRRQIRMQQHEFEKYLGIRHERYSEIIAPEGKKYAKRVNLGDFEGFVERQDFSDLKRNAQFRKLLLRKPQGNFDQEQSELAAFCQAASADNPKLLQNLLEKLHALHGTRDGEELAEAICNNELRIHDIMPPQQKKILMRDTKKILNGEDVSVQREMLCWVVDFALPSAEHQALRDKFLNTLLSSGPSSVMAEALRETAESLKKS